MNVIRSAVDPWTGSQLRPFDWSDDTSDPCAYCVQWSDEKPSLWPYPMLPSGLVERLYRHPHEACLVAVGRYVDEAAHS